MHPTRSRAQEQSNPRFLTNTPLEVRVSKVFNCFPHLKSVRERAQESSLPKPTLWSSSHQVEDLGCTSPNSLGFFFTHEIDLGTFRSRYECFFYSFINLNRFKSHVSTQISFYRSLGQIYMYLYNPRYGNGAIQGSQQTHYLTPMRYHGASIENTCCQLLHMDI